MKIAITDFWPDVDPENNFFTNSIRACFENVQVTDINNADFLIYSCFGNSHCHADRSKTKKIYYTGEAIPPNFSQCDYSLTFDIDDYGGKNFRLPLWMLQIDWFNRVNYGNPEFVLPLNKITSNRYIEHKPSKFCVGIFNQDKLNNRIPFMQKLNQYKPVTVYGKLTKNWFYGESQKYEILADHKFTMCFENGIYPGYHTEKLFHAKTAGCLPVYWSDHNLALDFNSDCCLNLYDYESLDHLVEKVVELDNSDTLYNEFVKQPLFNKEPSLDEYYEFLKKVMK